MKTEKIPRLNTASGIVFAYIFPPYCLGGIPWLRSYSKTNRGSWRLWEHWPRTALLQNWHFPLPGSSSSQSAWSFENQRDSLYYLCHHQPHLNETECTHTSNQNCLLIQYSGSDGKESACNLGSIPGSGRSSGEEGKGNPLQYPCLENHIDRGVWQSMEPQRVRPTEPSTAQLIYDAVLFSAMQQSAPIIHLCIPILFQILFSYGSLQSIE